MTPTQTIIRRMKELRTKRGWSARRLGEEMASAGVPWDRQVVSKLELGRRRTITADEIMALAYVFAVAPVHLMVPTDPGPNDLYEPVAGVSVDPERARAWIRGLEPIEAIDPRLFVSQVPADEFKAR